MKTLITLIASLTIVLGYSQTVNDIPLSEMDSEFVELLGTTKGLFSNKITIQLDYGQTQTYENRIVKDEKGQKVVFESMIDALNFMSGYGYEYLDAYALSAGGSNIYHYILRKKKEDN